MADVLFVQPWDRPWLDRRMMTERKKCYMSRAQFELGWLLPERVEATFLDLNLELKRGQRLEEAVRQTLADCRPRVVLVSFPAYALGDQVQQIVTTVRRHSPQAHIIIGGSVIGLVHDAPLRWWPAVDGCYNGFGQELPAILAACFARTRPALPGMYWRNATNPLLTRGEPCLVDGYDVEEFYAARGRLNFSQYAAACWSAGVEPMGIIEMTRGCLFRCSFCSLNADRLGQRSRSPTTVIREAEYLANQGIRYLHLIDPTLGLDRPRADELLSELVPFHQNRPEVAFETLTRPELVTPEFAQALHAAGVKRCAIGMESMEAEELTKVHKTLRPAATRRAVACLAECGIQTKLFHILFPNQLSHATLAFLCELSSAGVPFLVQSSFLRDLPTPASNHPFITQDQTVFSRESDTPPQLMEYLLANLAFPSMDIGGGGDPALREALETCLRRGTPLQKLFRSRKEGRELSLSAGGRTYAYIHREGSATYRCVFEM